MMLHEFVERTGIEPPVEVYEEIEEAYYRFDGNKDEFCKKFVEDGGLMKCVESLVKKNRALKSQSVEVEKELMRTIALQASQIEKLRADLEREEEWKPYVDEHNVQQSDYDRLAENIQGGAAHYMTEPEAIEWISRTTGFDPGKICIWVEIPEQQVNRHNRIRRTGKTIERRPIYCATDWHYILFSVCGRAWELYNDELRAYWC